MRGVFALGKRWVLRDLLEMLPAGGDFVQNVTGMLVGALLSGLVGIGYFAGQSWTRDQVRHEMGQDVVPRLEKVEKRQSELGGDIGVIKADTHRTREVVETLLDLHLRDDQ